jgi:hypothetical protein
MTTSKDGWFIATVCNCGTITVRHFDTLEEVCRAKGQVRSSTYLQFTEGDTLLVNSGRRADDTVYDYGIDVWEFRNSDSLVKLRELGGGLRHVHAAELSPDGAKIACLAGKKDFLLYWPKDACMHACMHATGSKGLVREHVRTGEKHLLSLEAHK